MLDIASIMTTNPKTLPPDASLEQARELMSHDAIRHIPILDDDGGLVGLVTQRDLLAATISLIKPDPDAVHEHEATIPVSRIMRTKIDWTPLNGDLRRMAIMMQQKKIGCVPVMDDGKLVGIVTDSDYVGLAINLLEQIEDTEPDEFDFDDDEVQALDA